MSDNLLEIYIVTLPGFEKTLQEEAISQGFKKPKTDKGGVLIKGTWADVWRANLVLRGASKVLVRIADFTVLHMAQLDKKAHQVNWSEILPNEGTFRVETVSKKSKVYHQRGASERIERAIMDTTLLQKSDEPDVVIKARIIENQCVISLDTSGEALHKRGSKQELNKAPLRETIAALILRHCGFKGKEAVLDPMCGSGTFLIEAGEMAKNLVPGRNRSFAFEKFANFDPVQWQESKSKMNVLESHIQLIGYDRDAGAIERSKANAERANILDLCTFEKNAISNIKRPDCEPGLIVINPPYGVRIGDRKKLFPLYQSIGNVLKDRFKGWRIGMVAHSPQLVKATGLDFEKDPLAFSHGGIDVRVYKTRLQLS